MATQKPVEQEGTYPLPEAQVDRFMLKTVIDYPNLEEEQEIVRSNINDSFGDIKPVVSVKEIIKAQNSVKSVYMDDKIEKYILDLILLLDIRKIWSGRITIIYKLWSLTKGSINLASLLNVTHL